ncbi:Crp/Fnr family transcriptional regulator [Algoriphagus sp. NG3]|uniref:Crp/Fnr family transcriptional regulator n=1 Tax=unclassified Algoriphagus TaxID=2641541 RepID=UPI002A7F3E42|nr:Crp/Fnr family transcriptional regulator [Algoriphagus sp. NG3]WPR77324.1 Crp/Fnr family transcriptional regulator [Algoriphagus sp. NG3]
MRALHNYLNRYSSSLISDAEFQDIFSHFEYKKVKRKQNLFMQGDVFKQMAFIVKGAMRKFYVDEKGVERVVDLYIENWWAGDRESFVMSLPSMYSIDAWEDCELLLISRENTVKLCNKCPAFTEFLLKLDERNSISAQKRITSSISLTAEKRYADFVERHPYFIQRFPQHVIASYLGITKDTLSRIRKQALKK